MRNIAQVKERRGGGEERKETPSLSPHFLFLALVSFLARPKPRIPFLRVFLCSETKRKRLLRRLFLLGRLQYPGEMKNKSYAKYWGANSLDDVQMDNWVFVRTELVALIRFLSRIKLPFPSPPNACHAGSALICWSVTRGVTKQMFPNL